MPRRLTLLAAATAAATLVGGGGWALVASGNGGSARTGATARPTAEARFLRLTGDAPAATPGTPGAQKAGAATGAAAGANDAKCAEDPATVAQMPNGWCIRPAGHNVEVLRFPLGLAPVDGGSKLVVSSDGGGAQGLTVIDAKTLQAVPTTQGNLFMGVSETSDGRVFASGGNSDRVFRFRFAGPALVSQDATEQATFPVHNGLDGQVLSRQTQPPSTLPATDGIRVPGYPGPMASYKGWLLVAGTLSEPAGSTGCPSGQQACARVSVIDPATDAVVARIPVGLDAIGLAVDAKSQRLFVANWGDEAGRGGSTGGTVSVVSLQGAPSTWHETSYVPVGHHPEAVQLSGDGSKLFVANTNDDSLSVVDISAATPAVVATETLKPATGLPVGAHPDALALSPDGKTLFVALAGLNAVEVRHGITGQRLAGAPVYIPTAWYPSALAVTGDAGAYRLWVANAKGTGPGPGYNGSVLANGTRLDGSVTAIDLPATDKQQNAWSKQVVENDNLDAGIADACNPPGNVKVSQVICPPAGKTSPIKHVLYIVTENKTFDQYFGDMDPSKGYRADPKYVLYGRPNTPNHHALADSYSLGDNFFSDAEVSVTGHSWTSGAIATDHNEKTWEADYDQGLRGTHGNGDPLRGNLGSGSVGKSIQDAEDELNDPEGGYIFEAFKRAGAVPPKDAGPGKLSMAIYGEHIARESGHALDDYIARGNKNAWKDGDIEYYDTCRALEFVKGQAPDNLVPYDGAVGSPPAGASSYGCQGRTLNPEFTLKHWTDVWNATKQQGSAQDVMPSFMYMSLPDNHTLATNVGSPTPQSMVADNDYAIGLIVDALSKSPFWSSTMVVQTEDDTQAAGDHVSALRDYLLVASPWAQPGANHQWGSMPALLRTIEQIFGVAPIALTDRLAVPMHEAFLPTLDPKKANFSPYDVQKPAVPFALNRSDAVGAQASAKMACWKTYDLCDEQTLNAILYAAIRGWPLRLPSGR
jgi:DNA-binding beta-propeller fold protein YncE